MMNKLHVACGVALILSGSSPAHTEPILKEGNANVICNYSHTLPDDPIVYPNRANVAMSHDFFGNRNANASSTAATLLAQADTTCQNPADSTAYWAPSLRLKDGTIIRPDYQKTYYTNAAPPSNNRYPVIAIPPGMKMLAGNHEGSAPNPNVTFLCTGSPSGYTNTIPTDCVPDPASGTQFNIGISYATCWDGVNLAPVMDTNMMRGKIRNKPLSAMMKHNNIAYADASGQCPSGYPKRIPHLSYNLAYQIGNVTDLTGAQLSLDPTLDAQGNVVALNWGSLYTAHGDFFSGWQPQALDYMANYCLNKERDCSTEVAYSYAEPSADSYVRGGSDADNNYGARPTLAISSNDDANYAVLRFAIPTGGDRIPASYRPIYQLMIAGGNVTNTSASTVYGYVMDNDWDQKTVTGKNAPACVTSGDYVGWYLDNARNYRPVDVSRMVNAAIAKGQTEISFCIQAWHTTPTLDYTFDSAEGANRPVLFLSGYDDHPH